MTVGSKKLWQTVLATWMLATSCLAGVPANVLFVLDGSGSMWAKVDGQEKMAIARETLARVAGELPAGVAVGLEVYGHTRKGDCNDIEILVPVGAEGRIQLAAMVSKIVPRGMTPITRALESAAEHLRSLEGETTVVLVSDGEETCEGDPCAAVQRLRELDIRLTAHVIGFDVGSKERAQLECIAQAGGGRYFSAAGAAELGEALRTVTTEVARPQTVRKSSFESGTEGWTIVGDGNLSDAGDPSLEDGAIKATDAGKGGVWYWNAPATYLGNRSSAYGRSLSYRLKTSGVDAKEWKEGDVVLEGAGLQLQHKGPRPSSGWTVFEVPLREEAFVHAQSGRPATRQELVRVLAHLEALRIRGEYRTGPDTGWLDDVRLGD